MSRLLEVPPLQSEQVRAALGRTLAATLATLPLAAALSWAIAELLASSVAARTALALLLLLPLWTFAMCLAFLARGVGQIWLACAGGTALFGGLAYFLAGG